MKRFLDSLNTHLVALGGLLLAVLAMASDPAIQKSWTDFALSLQGLAHPSAAQYVTVASTLFGLVGTVAAYYGRPHNVPSDGKPVPPDPGPGQAVKPAA